MFKRIIVLILCIFMLAGSIIPQKNSVVYAYEDDYFNNYESDTSENVNRKNKETLEEYYDYLSTSDSGFDPTQVAIEHEVESKRTKTSKTFKKTDGTYELVIYQDVIHYEKDGKLLDIDNRLTLDEKTDKYSNTSNKFDIKFPNTLIESKNIELSMEGYSINWRMYGVQSSKVQLENKKSDSMNKKELNNIKQSLVYKEVEKGVDLEYVVSGNSIKENILLNTYVSDFELTFEYNVEGLSLVFDQEENLIFINEKGETIFRFEELYMQDANFDTSYDIKIDYLQKNKQSYLIIIKPDETWLKNAKYPVKIDPSITAIEYEGYYPVDNTNGSYTYVDKTSNLSNSGTINMKLRDSYQEEAYGIFNFYLPEELSDKKVVKTQINFIVEATGGSNYGVLELYKNKTGWSDDVYYNGLGVNARPITEDIRTDSCELIEIPEEDLSGPYYSCQLEVTRDYVNGGDFAMEIEDDIFNENYGYSIFYSGNDIINSDSHILYVGTNQISSYKPVISFYYINDDGMKSYWTYDEHDVEGAGRVYVSHNNGDLYISRNDILFSTERDTLGLNMIYSNNKSSIDIGYGDGWRTNYSIFLDIENKVVEDYTGNIVQYYEIENNDICSGYFSDLEQDSYTCYFAEDGSGNILVSVENENQTNNYFLYTASQVRLYFDTSGKLISIKSDDQNKITKIEYVQGSDTRIKYILDTFNNLIEFTYVNSTLSRVDLKINQIEGDNENRIGNIVEEVHYVYNEANRLIEIEYYSNYDEDKSMEIVDGAVYEYDSSGLVKKITNQYENDNSVVIGRSLSCLYENKKISDISIKNNNIDLGYITYEREVNCATVRNHNNDYIIYSFDFYGHTIDVFDSNYISQSSEYMSWPVNGGISDYSFFTANRIISESEPIYINPGIIKNLSFESDSDWYLNTTSSSYGDFNYSNSVEFRGRTGKLELTQSSLNGAVLEQQGLKLNPGEYTIKGYYKTIGVGSVSVNISDNISQNFNTNLPSSTIWTEFDYQFIVTESSSNFKLSLGIYTTGAVYFDYIRIISSFTDPSTNIVKNPSFDENIDSPWIGGSYDINDDSEYIYNILGYLNGTLSSQSDDDIASMYQKINVETFIEEFDTIYFGFFSKLDISYDSNVSMIVDFLDSDQEYGTLNYDYSIISSSEIILNPSLKDWHLRSCVDTIPEGTEYIYISFQIDGVGSILVDNVFAYLQPNTTKYYYDDFGKIERISYSNTKYVKYFYSDNNENVEVEIWDTSMCSLSEVPEEECGRVDRKTMNYSEAKLTSAIMENIEVNIEYNEYGQANIVTVGDEESYYIEMTNYSSLGNQYISSTRDAFMHGPVYVHDTLTGLLSLVEDANGNEYKYKYNNKGQIEEVSNSDYCDESNNCLAKTIYRYDERNRLSEIELPNGDIYSLIYDSLGRIEEVKINENVSLIGYSYNVDNGFETDEINEKSYGNGYVLHYTYYDSGSIRFVDSKKQGDEIFTRELGYYYDESGRVSQIDYYDEDSVYSSEYYSYNQKGLLESVRDSEGNSFGYEYDSFNNLTVMSFTNINGNHDINYVHNKVLDYGESSAYNYNSSLYDKTNYVSRNGTVISKEYNYEEGALYRLNNLELLVSSNLVISQNINYVSDTTRISSFSYSIVKELSGGGTSVSNFDYAYSYDDAGNIIKISYYEGVGLKSMIKYEYDELNQLVVEDVYDSEVDCSVLGDTCYTKMYSYDYQGNIQETKTYIYGERDYYENPSSYITGSNIVVQSNNCNLVDYNNLNVGDSEPICNFTFYKDYSFPPVPISMTVTKLNNIDTSMPSYQLQEYKAVGRGYTLLIGVVYKVGNPPSPGVNEPIEYISYSYDNLDWGDQLSSFIYKIDGVTRISSLTYDNQGNIVSMTNFKYEDKYYEEATFEWSGRQLDKIIVDEVYPSSNNYLNENEFSGSYGYLSVSDILVKPNRSYTFYMPDSNTLGEIELEISGTTGVYINESTTLSDFCVESGGRMICSFMTRNNETSIDITINAEYIYDYFNCVGLEDIQLNEGSVPKSHDDYIEPITHEIEYEYNDLGYRISKTIDNVRTRYELANDLVVYETNGIYEIYYS
ncbi:MAG: hypothetical protein PHF05_02295, partial [Candidatus Izemoplasmatales bacterium]|nr:hypothetical protein [Candidatus Izemoplasmatales bacterium]